MFYISTADEKSIECTICSNNISALRLGEVFHVHNFSNFDTEHK